MAVLGKNIRKSQTGAEDGVRWEINATHCCAPGRRTHVLLYQYRVRRPQGQINVIVANRY